MSGGESLHDKNKNKTAQHSFDIARKNRSMAVSIARRQKKKKRRAAQLFFMEGGSLPPRETLIYSMKNSHRGQWSSTRYALLACGLKKGYSQWGFLPPLGAVQCCTATGMPVVNPTA
jgi:hypothetical protein